MPTAALQVLENDNPGLDPKLVPMDPRGTRGSHGTHANKFAFRSFGSIRHPKLALNSTNPDGFVFAVLLVAILFFPDPVGKYFAPIPMLVLHLLVWGA